MIARATSRPPLLGCISSTEHVHNTVQSNLVSIYFSHSIGNTVTGTDWLLAACPLVASCVYWNVAVTHRRGCPCRLLLSFLQNRLSRIDGVLQENRLLISFINNCLGWLRVHSVANYGPRGSTLVMFVLHIMCWIDPTRVQFGFVASVFLCVCVCVYFKLVRCWEDAFVSSSSSSWMNVRRRQCR